MKRNEEQEPIDSGEAKQPGLDSFKSGAMGCEIPFRLWLPEGEPKGIVYLLHGKSDHSESFDPSGLKRIWTPRLKVASLAKESGVAIAAPLCGNGWYLGRIQEMIADEFLPHVEAKLGLCLRRGERALMGFSMGGYGALALLCRRPELFGAALVKAPSDPVIRSPGGPLRDIAHDLIGPPDSTPLERYMECYSLRLLERLKGLDSALAICCGENDSLLPHCRALRERAEGLGLALNYMEVAGEHKLAESDLLWLMHHRP